MFTHNELVVPGSSERVWAVLVRASRWPQWYVNARHVALADGAVDLQAGAIFRWVTFGTAITCEVVHFRPYVRLGWIWWCPGAWGYHGWQLEPAGPGTRVVTEETQRGPKIARLAWIDRPVLWLAHAYWLHQLGRQVQGAHRNTER